MQSKKNLTNEQRKILDKIYSRQFDDVRDSYRRERDAEYSEMSNKIRTEAEAKATSNPKAVALVKEAKVFANKFETVSKELQKQGVSVEGVRIYSNDIRISFDSYRLSSDKLDAHNKVTREKLADMERAWLEVQAKIWGMDTTYADIVKDVDSVLASMK